MIVKDTRTGKNFFSFFLTRRFDATPTAPAGHASASFARNASMNVATF